MTRGPGRGGFLPAGPASFPMASSPFERYRVFLPGRDWTAFVEALERPEPRTFRIRRGRTTPEALLASLRRQGFEVAPVRELPGVFRVDREPYPLSETLEHWLGLFYIQQAATCLAAPALAPRPGEGILDLCAAPGGKSSHLAELMEDRGCLVAVDLAERRVQAMAGNLSRLAHPSVITVIGDALRIPENAPFHRVLADVPCSGEGRSRRDGPQVASAGDLRRLPRLQEALLRKALRLVPPGGRVLYVTCTLAPEENEAVVDRVLRTPDDGPGGSPPVRLVPVRPPVPHAPGLTRFEGARWLPELEGACRIHPHHLDSGGLFLALLERLHDDGSAAGPLPSTALELPGWTLPGTTLPAEATREARTGSRHARGGNSRSEARPAQSPEERVGRARAILAELLPTPDSGSGELGWMVRRDAVRFHRMPAWPLDAWEQAGERIRILSAGLRGMDEDRGGELRPSGDLLRWLGPGIAHRGLELDDEEWISLLDGAALRPDPETLPSGAEGGNDSIFLLRGGHPLVPARLKGDRILHELPPPRTRWLRQVLARAARPEPGSGPDPAPGNLSRS
ncbi:MAG: RsmB/NOP family class I SAM-dependent RNA methyltransferase [Gemmatimonadales bacterium]|nr:MAG: RsmB/NOP family class I SAM-dependent RNA methyltransferase [Gemmatimonadales bacterium]